MKILYGDNTDIIPRLQIVDEKQNFTEELPSYMEKWSLSEAGTDYNVVAVLGSQSTGKSTLLNKLFGTSFDTLDSNEISQTTKGIWLSRSREWPLLVMDVEGSGGCERAEDNEFEHKAALFSLAVSDLIILNLQKSEVNQYHNMGLLRTVFELNLQLFQQGKDKEKTVILIIIRDHDGLPTLEKLTKKLEENLDKVWTNVYKPKGLETCDIQDYFEFKYVALPHMRFCSEQFDEEVINLQSRFRNPGNNANCILHSRYQTKKRVYANDYHVYLSSIWDTLRSNKDLDILNHQKVLAENRCNEIAKAVFDKFMQQMAPLQKSVSKLLSITSISAEVIHEKSQSLLSEAMNSYEKDASRYNQKVFDNKRKELLTKCDEEIKVFYTKNNLQQVKGIVVKTSVLLTVAIYQPEILATLAASRIVMKLVENNR